MDTYANCLITKNMLYTVNEDLMINLQLKCGFRLVSTVLQKCFTESWVIMP